MRNSKTSLDVDRSIKNWLCILEISDTDYKHSGEIDPHYHASLTFTIAVCSEVYFKVFLFSCFIVFRLKTVKLNVCWMQCLKLFRFVAKFNVIYDKLFLQILTLIWFKVNVFHVQFMEQNVLNTCEKNWSFLLYAIFDKAAWPVALPLDC